MEELDDPKPWMAEPSSQYPDVSRGQPESVEQDILTAGSGRDSWLPVL